MRARASSPGTFSDYRQGDARVVHARIGQDLRDDDAVGIDAKMQLAPASLAAFGPVLSRIR